MYFLKVCNLNSKTIELDNPNFLNWPFNQSINQSIILQVEKAEKRKAMVANILDPNLESASKKSRLEQFGSSSAG